MDPELQAFAIELIKNIIPEIEGIVYTYESNPEEGFSEFIVFIKRVTPSVQRIIQGLRHPASVGHISPRLLRDPLSIDLKSSSIEEESHMTGYLKAILQLGYCIAKGLDVWQFNTTSLYEENLKTRDVRKTAILLPQLRIVRKEVEQLNPAELLKIAKERSESTKEYELANDDDMQTLSRKDETNIYKSETKDEETAVPFTARLMAYYREQENKRDSPLIVDPLAERLAGDMTSYADKHRHVAGSGDYPLVRSYYIERNLLTRWCNAQAESQIVLLGSGLDTRAYRFKPLQTNTHTIFEIDFLAINNFKEKILQGEQLLCGLERISADLNNPDWSSQLVNRGFSSNVPTFWVLEGLIYYMERDAVTAVLKKAAEMSTENSQIFADVCIPALADLVFGPFTRYFKWGLDKQDVPSFFATTGWNVSCSYADDHDQGRDVGQRGLIFVNGVRTTSS
ncbi:MAG: SAM-dependent methyltransferase [Candidatus Hodarchaeales archaeon]|jgi:methyltransferase (TIGR00027 family)